MARRLLLLSVHLALGLRFVGLIPGAPVVAQSPGVPPECVAADTTSRLSQPVVPPEYYAMLLAPGLLAWIVDEPCPREPSTLGFWRQHFSVTTALSSVYDGRRVGWALSSGAEVLVNGWYGELRVEEYRHSGPIRLRSLRGGYWVHPTPRLAGGATLGYRRASGDLPEEWTSPAGLEIGFPIVYGFRSTPRAGWLRYDLVYVIAARQGSIAPRLAAEFPISRLPLVAGFHVEGKGMRENDPRTIGMHARIRI